MDGKVDLDRELEAALGVDPSPEFVARIRTRIATEPAPSRRRLAWLVVPIAATAVVLLAVLTVDRRSSSPVAVTPPASSAAPSAPSAAAAVQQTDSAPPPDLPERGGRVQAAGQTAAREPELPDVLISPDEKRGFEMLLTALARHSLPPVPEAAVTVAELPPIEIESFTVEPLQMTQLE